MLNLAVLGAGDIVRKAYLPEISRRCDCKINAICSRQGKSAAELAARYGIPVVSTDFREIIGREDVEAVVICTPTASHLEMAEAAIQAGKHVLVEKPLCTRFTDTERLLKMARASTKTFYPAFNNQFREENQYFRKKVRDGEIGEIEIIDFEWYRTRRYEEKTWLFDPAVSGGGVLIDLGSHMLHLALSLIPGRKEFRAFGTQKTHGVVQTTVEDTATGMICVDERITILLKTGWDMMLPVRSRVNLQVYGTRGETSNHAYQGQKSEGYPAMIEDFLEYVIANKSPDLNLTLDAMRLVDALYRSAADRQPVEGSFSRTG